jgi:hypothetical protein
VSKERGQDSGNGRAEDEPRSDKPSAEACTRLEASYAANSSLEEGALRPVPQLSTGQHGQVRFAMHRRPHRQLTEILLVMVRLSLI